LPRTILWLPASAIPLLVAVGAAVGATASSSALPRALADRPDEVTGPQIHVVYAVPADGEDRHLDELGVLEGSVTSFQHWLAQETGGRTLRMDIFEQSLDVTFVRLAATDGELAARGAFVRDGIESELSARGLTAPGKLYAVYYDGTSDFACGGASWPPQLPGNVVALYLRGLPAAQTPCGSNGFRTGDQPPAYWEYGMVHEVFHGLGLVPTCAPNHHRSGHVNTPSDDLMWAGDGTWRFPAKLDVGRDDYYGHGRAGCPDLARSPYLLPLRLKVESFGTTAKARAGRVFRATLRIDANVESATCVARAGTKRLRPTALVLGRRAECSWRVPAKARGKRLTGSVTARAGGSAVTRTFSRRVLR
jgi:hypothetical protein